MNDQLFVPVGPSELELAAIALWNIHRQNAASRYASQDPLAERRAWRRLEVAAETHLAHTEADQ